MTIVTEQRSVTLEKRITIGYTCDCCGKYSDSPKVLPDWHEFTVVVYDRGTEINHACSPGCYFVLLENFREKVYDADAGNNAEIDGKSITFVNALVRYIERLKLANEFQVEEINKTLGLD